MVRGSRRPFYPEFEVNIEDVIVRIDAGDLVFAEYPVHAVAAPTGRLSHHLFMVYLVAKDGKIAFLREGLNTVAAASALLPGGVHDLPAPTEEVHAFWFRREPATIGRRFHRRRGVRSAPG